MITLQTPRLVLEPLSLAHAPAFQHWLADEGIARMTASFPHPYPDGEAERYIVSRTAGMDPQRPTFFAICIEAEPIGGAMLFHTANTAPDALEIGYWIARPHWGRGYAREVVAVLVEYGFGQFGIDRLLAGVAIDNPASERVLAVCGFRAFGSSIGPSKARGHDVELHLWRLDRPVSVSPTAAGSSQATTT